MSFTQMAIVISNSIRTRIKTFSDTLNEEFIPIVISNSIRTRIKTRHCSLYGFLALSQIPLEQGLRLLLMLEVHPLELCYLKFH